MIIQCEFGSTQANVTFQFYDVSGNMLGSPNTSAVEGPAGSYIADVTVPSGAVGVYWACDNPLFYGTEGLRDAILLEANLDVPVSSRNDIAPATPSDLDASETAIIAAITAIPAAVWSAGTRTLSGFGTLVADIWAAATRTLTASADSSGVTTLLARLTAARATLIDKLDVGEPDDPVIVIPAPPADASLGTVYGYLETPEGAPAANIVLKFTLIAPNGAKADRIIAGDKALPTTDPTGFFSVQLQRNDRLDPAGTKWQVDCAAIRMKQRQFELATDLFDLAELIA
jgi:hypothetical protein